MQCHFLFSPKGQSSFKKMKQYFLFQCGTSRLKPKFLGILIKIETPSPKWDKPFAKLHIEPTHSCLLNIQGMLLFVQLLSHAQLFATPWIATQQASLSFTISQSLLKLMSIESVMPSNHLILFHLFLLLPSISPSNRVSSSESALCIRWPKYWSFSFSISPSNEYSGLISFRID